MPVPNTGETREEFVERCIPIVLDDGTAEDSDQAVAVCNSMWEGEDKAADSTGTDEAQVGGTTPTGNALKAIARTDDELRVANYLVVFGGRDLEGIASPAVNADGSRGEYFTPETDLESQHTKAGVLFVDWEHGQDSEPGPGDVLGVVDWKTARKDEQGVWVERVLNRRSKYVRWLEPLIEGGLIGTSSEAIPDQVQKAADGQITRWPLRRDTLTVTPMEPRMMTENQLQAFKALGIDLALDDTGGNEQTEATPEPEHETAPEADLSAVAVAKARARLQRFKLSQLEE